MSPLYLDETNNWSDPGSTNYKYLQSNNSWTDPDSSLLYLDSNNEFSKPNIYPPTEFPTSTIDTPEKLRQALIAAGQGHLPVPSEYSYNYPVGIQIDTNFPHITRAQQLTSDSTDDTHNNDYFEITEHDSTTFYGKIVGFNNYLPYSMTVVLDNVRGAVELTWCNSGNTLNAVSNGLYHVDSWAGSNAESLLYYTDDSNREYSYVTVNRDSFGDINYLYHNMYKPYFNQFEEAINKAISPEWSQYFKVFTKDYSVMTAELNDNLIHTEGSPLLRILYLIHLPALVSRVNDIHRSFIYVILRTFTP